MYKNMNKNIKNTFRLGLLAMGVMGIAACSDTWDDHYDARPSTTFNGTTLQAIEQEAPEFAAVIKKVGYDRELNSENIYTIWAPTEFNFDSVNAVAAKDPKAVIEKFIKNHISRYAVSLDGTNREISLMSSKLLNMTGDGQFGPATILKSNLSCDNGVIHVINKNVPYQNNIFEEIQSRFDPESELLSMYYFLKAYDADSLDENKSVSRGVDDNGDKIWVDSVTIRNNTILNSIDAQVYEEDSSFIAIIPSSEAYSERFEQAKQLLIFNPSEDVVAEGACDSLQYYYGNMFAMSDLFFNRNANEHDLDSLKSTLYVPRKWEEHRYYTPYAEGGILSPAKYTEKINCSNGTAYVVDEYPMTVIEQFFKIIEVAASAFNLDLTTDDKDNPIYTKSVDQSFSTHSGTIYDYETDEFGDTIRYLGTRTYRFLDVKPASSTANPQVAFKIPNTLSGTYELYLITCPIWAKTGYSNGETAADDPRPYRFFTYIWERENSGSKMGRYPSSGKRLPNPDGSGNYFVTNVENKIDTLYLGDYTFKNAYYNRNDEGVLIQFHTQISSTNTSKYSREMLISGILLKPKFEEEAESESKRR